MSERRGPHAVRMSILHTMLPRWTTADHDIALRYDNVIRGATRCRDGWRKAMAERDAARADAAQARAELDSYLRPSPLCDAYDPDEQPDYLRGLEREVEMRAADLAKPRGGMQVPFHGDFASAPPSTINRLQWWLREIKKQREAERADAARLREALECVAKMECTEHGDDQDGACQSCAALSAARRALDETGKDGAA